MKHSKLQLGLIFEGLLSTSTWVFPSRGSTTVGKVGDAILSERSEPGSGWEVCRRGSEGGGEEHLAGQGDIILKVKHHRLHTFFFFPHL